MEEGCIVIRGSIRDSILWKDPVKLRWFLDMLLLADHPDAEKSKRGQIVMSLGNWSKRWLVSRDVVRHFFEFLEKNGIILRDRCAQQSAQFYAQITICGFDDYKEDAHSNPHSFTHSYLDVEEPTEEPRKAANKRRKKSSETKEEEKTVTPINPEDIKDKSINYRARILFEGYVRNVFGIEYYWEAKDAASMNAIIKKMKYQRRMKNLPEDDDGVLEAISYFLSGVEDPWIMENFSVTNLNNKFNEIINQIKNKNNGRRKSRKGTDLSFDDISEAVEFGSQLAGNKG